MKTIVAFVALVFGSSSSAFAQARPVVVERTEERRLVSKSNGIAYKLFVALPHDYGTSKRSYPVVYLLDSDYSFLIARNIADHLAEREHLRELILVGIGYDGPKQYQMNRTRDYTPAFSPAGGYGPEMQKVSGGGARFRDFLQKELIPFIDQNYRTISGDRCLVGHSYGGLFASWTLLTTPSLFQRFIIVSPSLWYRDRMMFLIDAKAGVSGRAYFAVGAREGNDERDMIVDLREFTKKLRASQKKLTVRTDILDDETHNSVFPRALSNGLRYVFEAR